MPASGAAACLGSGSGLLCGGRRRPLTSVGLVSPTTLASRTLLLGAAGAYSVAAQPAMQDAAWPVLHLLLLLFLRWWLVVLLLWCFVVLLGCLHWELKLKAAPSILSVLTTTGSEDVTHLL